MAALTPRRTLGWCAVLAAGVLLLAPGDSQAQMFRGGRGYGGGGWGGGWGGGYRGDYGWGSPGYGYGYGNGLGYNSYYPSYGSNYYSSPGYNYYGTTPYAYNYPYTSQGSVVTPTYTYPQGAYAYPQGTMSTTTESLYRPAVAPNSARLTVMVPAADARVYIQGQEMTESGMTRQFVSPSLTPGENYTYEVRAVWNQNGQAMDQTRTARVRANETATVDFRVPQGNSSPLPSGTTTGTTTTTPGTTNPSTTTPPPPPPSR